jgi:hypothetical protein
MLLRLERQRDRDERKRERDEYHHTTKRAPHDPVLLLPVASTVGGAGAGSIPLAGGQAGGLSTANSSVISSCRERKQ